MTLILDSAPTTTPLLTQNPDLRLAHAAALLWRVIDRTGHVIGHLQAIAAHGGVRYRARRFHSASRCFRDLGEFWSPDDAVDCLRYAR